MQVYDFTIMHFITNATGMNRVFVFSLFSLKFSLPTLLLHDLEIYTTISDQRLDWLAEEHAKGTK